MSEKLTDEQLRKLADELTGSTFEPWGIDVGVMASTILALRAERAKPTQIDEEWAQDLAHTGCGCDEIDAESCHNFFQGVCERPQRAIAAAFASIRAEGSAEREKLEAALRRCRPFIGCFSQDSASKLVEEIEGLIGKYDWFAQPAESGAREPPASVAWGERRSREIELRYGEKP